jgi:hypothetical protein
MCFAVVELVLEHLFTRLALGHSGQDGGVALQQFSRIFRIPTLESL